jgi:hypothetical protein
MSVADMFAGRFSDVDAGSFLAGVAVIGNAEQGNQGTWQYSTDGGATWIAIGSVGDDASALVLDPAARLRFLPAPGFGGAPAGLSVRALDDSYAGGFSVVAAGVETRAVFDASLNGGASAVAAGTASIDTRVDLEGPVIILDSDLEPTVPPPPVAPEGPIVSTPADDPVVVSTPELVTTELGPVDPDLFEPDEPVAPPGIGADFARVEPSASSGEAVPSGEAPRERRSDAEPADGGAGALATLLRTEFAFLDFGTEFSESLDRLRRDARDDSFVEQAIAGSSLALTAGLSVGYVIWLTRGGLLLASLTSSLPVWRLIDPIPILASLARRSEDDPEDEESLDSLVDPGRKSEDSPARGRAEPRVKERSEP